MGNRLFLLPYERTTSFLKGAGAGPRELNELIPPAIFPDRIILEPGDLDAEEYLRILSGRVKEFISTGRPVVALGGEHTLTYGLLRGFVEAGLRPTVIQLDAHADLRDEYEGTPWSHACVMRRIVDDLRLPSLALGVRSLSLEEAEFISDKDLQVIYAHRLAEDFPECLDAVDLPGSNIYLTVDIDFFDPAVAPGTGTPEPGGMGWYDALEIIDYILAGKKLLGFDLMEFAPPVERGRTAMVALRLLEYISRRYLG